jgi:hypothetical protein
VVSDEKSEVELGFALQLEAIVNTCAQYMSVVVNMSLEINVCLCPPVRRRQVHFTANFNFVLIPKPRPPNACAG